MNGKQLIDDFLNRDINDFDLNKDKIDGIEKNILGKIVEIGENTPNEIIGILENDFNIFDRIKLFYYNVNYLKEETLTKTFVESEFLALIQLYFKLKGMYNGEIDGTLNFHIIKCVNDYREQNKEMFEYIDNQLKLLKNLNSSINEE